MFPQIWHAAAYLWSWEAAERGDLKPSLCSSSPFLTREGGGDGWIQSRWRSPSMYTRNTHGMDFGAAINHNALWTLSCYIQLDCITICGHGHHDALHAMPLGTAALSPATKRHSCASDTTTTKRKERRTTAWTRGMRWALHNAPDLAKSKLTLLNKSTDWSRAKPS